MRTEKKAACSGQRVLIGGCSHLGALLADALSLQGSEVTVIDACPQSFYRLPDSFSGKQITGDIRDPQLLEEAGIRRCTLFLACTGRETVNLFCAQAAKIMYEVPEVICRIKNQGSARLLDPWKIRSVSPVALSAEKILKEMEENFL